MESPLELIEQSFNNQYSNWVHEELDELPDSFTITDPCISGHPIVFVSQGFLKMCGYSKDEVIGKNGRMFQGPGTNRRTVMEIREAIREERATEISILNYHKNGAPFWILFHMSPVFRNSDGRITHFIGVQVPISRQSVGLRGGVGKNSVDLCRQWYRSGELLLGSCPREICCSKSTLESGSGSACDSVLDSRKVSLRLVSLDFLGVNFGCTSRPKTEIEDSCEASELEKQKASNAVSNIISVLSRYSELTGNPVSGRRCNMHGTSALSSALIISLGRIKQSFVLYDPHLPNFPIAYASDAFLTMTGYARHEVLGCSRNLLCGLETNPSSLELIEESVNGGRACKARILYYRKDRSSFWSHLSISPVRNASGKIAYFVEVQVDEDDEDDECKNPNRLSPEQRQLSAIGAVKVAIRTQSIGPTK
ncbi:hypothetical protein V2J09_015395 [Rumex salicifolius]